MPNPLAGILKSAVLGAAALLLSLFVASAANAQCGPAGAVGISSATGLLAALNTVNTAFLTQTNAFVAGQASSPNQVGGGLWLRGIGGHVTLDSAGTVTFLNPPAAPSPCTTRMNQQYAGFQFGGDIAKLNLDGANIHFGMTAGYVDARGDEVGGPATGRFEVPFIGAYAAMIKGGFFADVMFRYDFYQMSISQFQVGLNNQHFDGHTFSVSGSAGYHHSFGSWFLEPSVGLIWARFNVNPIAVAGNGAFSVPAGTLFVNDIDSLLGRVGVRIGTTIVSGDVVFQPFLAASVWHEFAKDAVLRFDDSTATTVFNLTTGRVGTYAQYAVGISSQVRNTGWVSYARVDYRKGDDIEAWGVNAGLRYQFGNSPPPALIRKN